MAKKKFLGSGPQYFDIKLAENNAPSPNRQKPHSWAQLSPQERIEASYLLVDDLFKDFDLRAWPNIKSLLDQISSNPALHHHLAFRMPSPIQLTSYNAYPNNRITLFHVLSRRPIPVTPEGIEAYKYTINALVRCGLNPLEKCYEDGHSPLAILIENRSATIDMLKFFASLHPQSLSSFDEEKSILLNVFIRASKRREIFEWAIQAMPPGKIKDNIKAIDDRRALNPLFVSYREQLVARLEKIKLEKALHTIPQEASTNTATLNPLNVEGLNIINKPPRKTNKV